MAIKIRKLYPTLAEANQTGDCSGLCDPACPYNCYPDPDYYFLPPPPPPPSPPSLPQEHHLSPYVIVTVSVLASLFLLVSYYVIVAKSFPAWCGTSNNRQPEGEGGNAEEEFLDENGLDHPIWFITTIGLQQSIINSIAVCRYRKGEGLIEGSDCSVCLSEFQENETLRLLPKCNHAFHISCIDTWLRSHTNCPMCRARIVNDAISAPLISANPDNSSTTVNTQLENSEIDQELGNNQGRNDGRENRAREEEGRETLQTDNARTLKEDTNSNGNGDFRMLCESGDYLQSVKNYLHPMRRSFSMDSLTTATICFHSPVESEGSSVNLQKENTEKTFSSTVFNQDNKHSSSFKLMGSCSVAQCLHKSPVCMKRSSSCGGRFFSPRQSQSLNSILPL